MVYGSGERPAGAFRLITPQPAPEPAPSPPGFDDTLRAFRVREIVVRGKVWQSLEREAVVDDRLTLFGGELGLHLRAALALGELEVAAAYLDWVRGCRQMAWLSEGILRRYLVQYAQEVRRWMGADGEPVADWLLAYSRRLEETG